MHNPEQVAKDFAEKLASKNRHVMFLLGAGASCAAGLPTLNDLKAAVGRILVDDDKKNFQKLGTSRNIEEILSRLRLVAEVLTGTSDSLDGFTSDTAQELDKKICSAISTVIQGAAVKLEAHLRFAQWCVRSVYIRPLEVFTLNYDNVIERGLEQIGVPYFDGFAGTYEGLFRADLVDSTDGRDDITPPPAWVRVWKLHGSISWSRITSSGGRVIVRSATPGESLAVYPSIQKYQESRRVPFVVLGDRLRRALAIPETTCVVSGYSFGDQHINDLIYEAAQFYQASEIIVLCYSDIPTQLVNRATSLRNLTVCAPSKGIIGAVESTWQKIPDDTAFWKSGAFTLGDFAALTQFLLVNTKLGADPFLFGGGVP
jgi:SIR2-like protein